jgi:hypothetical protein
MKENIVYICLIKFGEEKYLNSLLEFGEIYMNPVAFFRKIEDASIRDEHEGANLLYQGEMKLYLDAEQKKPVAYAPNTQLYIYDKTKSGNLYCMFAITSITEKNMILHNVNERFIDKRLYENRNKKCIYIINPNEFIKRIEIALKKEKLEYQYDMVKYYNEKTFNTVNLNPFQKSNKFEHENEFRFFVKYKKDEPIILNIGSIKDISSTIYDGNQISYGFKKQSF